MDFHFSSSPLSSPLPPPSSLMTKPPCTPPQHSAPFLFLFGVALSLAEGGNIGRTGREEGREARGKWSVGSGSSLSLCHSYDSRVIRLINEIIDHLMGLIINCFSTVSCPISSSSSSLLMLLYSSSLPVLPPLMSNLLCVSEGQNRHKRTPLARTPGQHLKLDSASDGDFRKERFSGSVPFLLVDCYFRRCA